VIRSSPSSGTDRVRDDAGGVWIWTGWALGVLVYLGVVVAWHAGFTPAAPFVVIPAVLVVMIGVGNLVGGRRPGRAGPRFNRPDLDPAPVAVLHGDPGPAPADDGTDGAPAGEPGPTP
jgi:hypothetical protein